MKNPPYFSLIIPVSRNTNRITLNKCLEAVNKQDYKRFEVILIEERNTFLSKSQSRNYGAKKAKGDFLVHIDIDYLLPSSILRKCKKLITKNGADVIILHETIKPTNTIWQRARKLERDITLNDIELSAPQVISKNLFEKIGGFDERVDLLDDWSLSLKLKTQKANILRLINPLTPVHEPTNFFEILHRRYNKGRSYPAFIGYYQNIPQTQILPRLANYSKNSNKIIQNPLIFFCLVLLKTVDQLAFWLGSLNPKIEPDRIYQDSRTAKTYDAEQKTIYGRLKHKIEINALLTLLGKSDGKILELGAGSGRITSVLVKKGYTVTPTDISKEMLAVYQKKIAKNNNLPTPLLVKSEQLPFKNNSFDSVIAMRVFWHITNAAKREKFFNEAVRVAKKYIIMDFAYLGSGNDHLTNFKEIQSLTITNNIKSVSKKYLPLGRLLFKFKKSNHQ